MITQCSIRHLYTLKSTNISLPAKESLIATAKTMERRRCNHHELDEPLSTLECLSSIIDPKGSKTNKNRYVVASQEEGVRRYCRGVKGVPLLYVKRSVMIMEPMSKETAGVRARAEKEKFRQGLRGRVAGLGKRKRDKEDSEDEARARGDQSAVMNDEAKTAQRRRTRGVKGPNPLSVKKPKIETKKKNAMKNTEGQRAQRIEPKEKAEPGVDHMVDIVIGAEANASRLSERKKKRRRKKPTQNKVFTAAEEGEGENHLETGHKDAEGMAST